MEAVYVSPAELTAEALTSQIQSLAEGYIKIDSGTIQWFIYCKQGQVVYASNSVEPFERLERIIKSSLRDSSLSSSDLLGQVRSLFEQLEADPQSLIHSDYQVLHWLVEEKHLEPAIAQTLIHRLMIEVLESYCLLPNLAYPITAIAIANLPSLYQADLNQLLEEAQARLQIWKGFLPHFYSPYQRPYLTGAPLTHSNLDPEFKSRLRQLLIGFSFRQIAMLVAQDEIDLARQFLPLVQQGVIHLHDPFSPFDQLPWRKNWASSGLAGATTERAPMISENSSATSSSNTFSPELTPGQSSGGAIQTDVSATPQKVWKIVCIDDSTAVLKEIERFLEADLFSLTLIDDSKKALMKISSVKPDIVLLDANMPGIDGYQVCSMLRKSSSLKDIPVIMVTGNRGLMNRARAKVAGVTDYLNKPFTQKELLDMVFRHLNT